MDTNTPSKEVTQNQPTQPTSSFASTPTISIPPAMYTAAWREKRHKQKMALMAQAKALETAHPSPPEDIEVFRAHYLATDGNITEASARTWPGINRDRVMHRGRKLLEQLQSDGAVLAIMEKKGLTLGKFIDVLSQKIGESKTPEWWDRGMAMRPDGRDFLSQKGGNQVGIINIVEAQKKILGEYGEDTDDTKESSENPLTSELDQSEVEGEVIA